MPEKFALVTGACSGIGLEMSWLLADRDYNLLLVSNEEERLLDLNKKISEQSQAIVKILHIDLAKNDAAEEVFKYCNENDIEVEVLINNAGFFFFGEVAEADIKKAGQKILLHILTSSLLCTLFGKKMKEEGKGYIMNVSSISAYKAFPGIAHYGSTKSFIKYFTRSLRTEMKAYGVNVSCLCPGATLTNLYDPNVINVEAGKKFGIMMSAKKVAKQGINGLFSNKALIMPGFITRLMMYSIILTPQFVIVRVWKRYRTKWVR